MKPHSLNSFAISVLCWLRLDSRELGDCLLLESAVEYIYDSLLEDDTDNEAIFLDILVNMVIWICDLDTSDVCVCNGRFALVVLGFERVWTELMDSFWCRITPLAMIAAVHFPLPSSTCRRVSSGAETSVTGGGPTLQIMQNLSSLVVQAEQKWEVMEDIVLLSKVHANLPILFSHPGLASLAIKYTQQDRIPALYLLLSLASDDALQRPLFLHPAFKETILACCCTHHENEDVQNTAMLIVLLLINNEENKRDFLNFSNSLAELIRVIQTSDKYKVQAFAFAILQKCVDSEDEQILRDFFFIPGMVQFLIDTTHVRYKFQVFAKLSAASCVSKEMFVYPGLLAMLVECIKSNDNLQIRTDALKTLRGVVESNPIHALEVAGLIDLLVNLGENGESMSRTACTALIRWHASLANHGTTALDRQLKKKEVLNFWRNVPVMWALIGMQRLKKRSALRRLPVEMMRLLCLTLNGTNM